MTKRKHHDDDAEVEVEDTQPSSSSAEVQPGCSEPDKLSPSVVGTSQDPNRKQPDKQPE